VQEQDAQEEDFQVRVDRECTLPAHREYIDTFIILMSCFAMCFAQDVLVVDSEDPDPLGQQQKFKEYKVGSSCECSGWIAAGRV
jgi:hypothetical protein